MGINATKDLTGHRSIQLIKSLADLGVENIGGKPIWCWALGSQEAAGIIVKGAVEKSRQRRSRHFSVLTYSPYAPRIKMAAALLNELF